jgi:CRISPR-associated exonuclease Cas4
VDEADGDVVTLSEIEHYAYCARQWALIHLDRMWADNEPTAVGHIVHSRVDEVETRPERGGKVARSLTVWSDTHGLFGRADTVEFRDGEAPLPIEHKSGRRAMLPARLQLGAQAICLEEMFGQPVVRGVVWLHGRRRRHEVPISDELKRQVLVVAELIRVRRSQPGLPPSVFDSRCPDCSLIDECLPALVIDSRRILALHRGLFDPGPRHVPRDA